MNTNTKGAPLDYQKYIDWINNQDVFWTNDIFVFFNVTRVYTSREQTTITKILSFLRKSEHIQCCNSSKISKQYILI